MTPALSDRRCLPLEGGACIGADDITRHLELVDGWQRWDDAIEICAAKIDALQPAGN